VSDAAAAIGYALLLWWLSTALIFLLVLRGRRFRPVSLVVGALLVPASLYGLARSSADPSVFGAYMAFTCAVGLWGAQEIGFLTGAITGPRPVRCPPHLPLVERGRHAIGAILYHELAIVVSGLLLLIVTRGAPNQIGAGTFLILWIMRLCAKLNLFLGVPVVTDAMMPPELDHLRSYFRRSGVTLFFKTSMTIAVAATAALAAAAFHAPGVDGEVGYCLMAALLGLAVIEHLFMLAPLPLDALWAWCIPSSMPRPKLIKARTKASVRSV
jgi:putative photosynthetic complex assembly protein 2